MSEGSVVFGVNASDPRDDLMRLVPIDTGIGQMRLVFRNRANSPLVICRFRFDPKETYQR